MTQDATGYQEESSGDIVVERGKMAKQESSTSFMSYDTQDIQEERADNSKKSKFYLFACICVNIAFSLWYLSNVVQMTHEKV